MEPKEGPHGHISSTDERESVARDYNWQTVEEITTKMRGPSHKVCPRIEHDPFVLEQTIGVGKFNGQTIARKYIDQGQLPNHKIIDQPCKHAPVL